MSDTATPMNPDHAPSGAPGADRYAVLGHPVAHSRSPAIHAAFARQTGQALDYGRLEVAPGGFEAAVRAFAADGARGCNVTVPFKFDAFRLAAAAGAALTERARLAQAVNTLRFDGPEPAQWQADNTDGAGLVTDLTAHAGFGFRGRTVLLVGAGGAAAGVLGPLIAARPADLVVVNRSPGRAQLLTLAHRRWAERHGVPMRAGTPADAGSAFDLVVNATSSSLDGAAPPVHPAVLKRGALAVDLMYGPAARPFLAWAAARGARGRDGLGMLVEQAAAAFALWRGVRPDTAPVLQALRAELDAVP
jgi:shikimate dehydrogenase